MSLGTIVLSVAAVVGLRTVAREWTGRGWAQRTGRQGGRWYQLAVREVVVAEVAMIALALPVSGFWTGLVFLACIPVAVSIALFNRPRFLVPPPHRATSWRH